MLRYRPPYDWPAMLGFLRARAITGVESVEGGVYRRTIGLDGQQGTVTVRPGGENALEATVRFPKLSALPQIIARLRRVFDLAADPTRSRCNWSRTRPSRRWWRLGRVCACRAPGTGSSWRCERCWDNKSRCPARSAWPASWWPGSRKAARPGRALTHVFPDPAALAGADLASLGMPEAAARTTGGRGGGGRRSAYLRCRAGPGGSGRATARVAGHRRMDRAIYRDAATSGAGRFSGGGYRPDARDGGL